ncbi:MULTISPECIES: hypothetical protein [Gordonia]|uniref:hypothetical protein n=1 Tax=Gordonia TaxID=2053 RepID=UPI0004B53CDD|nr:MULTISPECIES: hypothetical protein [Gordonia]MDH3008073.1 hypothetical protein [Gordonia alkanivorans]MDH3016868.1 hypothetical protein [Gordonia alkanivorans]MDH3020938.1 hypothetical protein [Gordonia alkanivorans]MDH3042113.1 hypothetical protein [Gordonia alkanivorans]MDH3060207.1 hypothetical protein [Gordonia alkanivorans]
MKRFRLLSITAFAIATLTISLGTAHGAPAPAAPSHLTIGSADGTSITSTLRNATFVSTGNELRVVDPSGRILERVALTLPLDRAVVPLRTQVSTDRTQATFTPILTPEARAAIAAGVRPASAKRDRAYQQMIWHINNGWNHGGNVATAIGALAGLIIGCLVIVGCIWGAGVGAAIGAAIGISNGDPATAQSILDWINTP